MAAAHEWSLYEAKNRFSAVVNAAVNGTAQLVTKRGKPAVVVLSVDEYDRLKEARTPARMSFVDYLLSAPKLDLDIERLPPSAPGPDPFGDGSDEGEAD